MILVIEKESNNVFSLTYDGGEAIRTEQNRLTTVGDFTNFKTANGANLILKQNIFVEDITVIASGTFNFTDINDLWNKLIGIGFFNGVANSGGGSVVDRFDQLADTFDYFGRDGQVVTVNESQLRLETQPISLFTPADRDKLDGIQAESEVNVRANWNETDPESKSFIENKPNINALFSGIYDGKFTPNEVDNTFTLPIGAQAINLFIDRGVRYKNLEWTQNDNIVTVLGDQLAEGTDIYITGLTI